MLKNSFNLRKIICRTLFAVAASFLVVSCNNEENDSVTEYDISDIYGYEYQGTVNASSGATLKPSLILYDESQMAWNMSSSGYSDNIFYYYSEKKAVNLYRLYWFEDEIEMKAYKAGNANYSPDMVVALGINSVESVSAMVINASEDEGAGSAMAGTPITMTLLSYTKKSAPEQNDTENNYDYTTEVSSDGLPYATYYVDEKCSYTGTTEHSSLVISIDSITYTSSGSWGTHSFTTPTITNNDGVYSVSAEGSVDLSMPGSTVSNSYTSSIEATITNGYLSGTITMEVGKMGTVILELYVPE